MPADTAEGQQSDDLVELTTSDSGRDAISAFVKLTLDREARERLQDDLAQLKAFSFLSQTKRRAALKESAGQQATSTEDRQLQEAMEVLAHGGGFAEAKDPLITTRIASLAAGAGGQSTAGTAAVSDLAYLYCDRLCAGVDGWSPQDQAKWRDVCEMVTDIMTANIVR